MREFKSGVEGGSMVPRKRINGVLLVMASGEIGRMNVYPEKRR